jgi:lipopolysaccharide/colanic/teichoic acid biosynthesis glycosyltransferase
MTSTDHAHSTVSVEQTLQPIPEDVRTHRVSGQFWIWCGANIAPINWVLGALGIALGLGLRDTLIVLVLGNLIGMAVFGLFVLMGQRTGVTGMVLSRAAFGRRGAYLPAAIQACLAIGWCAVNTWIILDLVMALLGKIGLVDPAADNYGWKILVAALIMVIQVAISWAGYKAIATFERWTVPPTIVVLIAMSVVAWTQLDIDWGYAGPAGQVLTGTARWVAMSGVMTAIGIGWGITWFTYAADYSRFVSREVPKRKLYLASTLGQFIPVVWLGVLGATLAIRIESGRGAPILYRQERVGERGKGFPLIKFRSMRTDAEKDGVARWASQHDDRVTRVGRFIRKVRIDELPQLWNVLRGDMSLIGPRPERPTFVADLATKIKYYELRHCVKPGLAGWAQLNYPYGATEEDAAEKLKYDLFYVKNHNLMLDLMILIQTLEVVLFRRGAR